MLINLKEKKKIFIFLDRFINNSIEQIIKYKNISIIYRNYESSDEEEFKKIFKISKKKNISLFVAYNELLIKKYSIDGFYIPSFVKKKIYVNKKILLIGSAHNYLEIYQKLKQGCKIIFLSPIFSNKNNKNLGFVKYNLITRNFNTLFCALGGINSLNIRKIYLTKSIGVSGIRIINHLKFINNFINLNR